jgi:lipopolysaccharide/colanic/teichoic acid biosynthesis glycosyltransferase
MLSRVFKRAADFFFASLALILALPLILGIALAVRLTMGRPVLFRQDRPGLNGKPFRLVKFRTMKTARNCADTLLPDEERITKLGNFLRRFSLDELPQLWNVWKGDMSVVGPRPLLVQYLQRYSSEQARRHEVKPGITGWAQVNGRNALNWEEKFRLDVWYVDHWSLRLDAKILFLTVKKVTLREDISQRGYATMPEFMGSGNYHEEKGSL